MLQKVKYHGKPAIISAFDANWNYHLVLLDDENMQDIVANTPQDKDAIEIYQNANGEIDAGPCAVMEFFGYVKRKYVVDAVKKLRATV